MVQKDSRSERQGLAMEMEELTKRQETKLEMGGLTRLGVSTSEGQDEWFGDKN